MNATEHMEARRRAEEEPERARISSHETATAEASFTVVAQGNLPFAGPGDPLPPFDTPTVAVPGGVDPVCTSEPACPSPQMPTSTVRLSSHVENNAVFRDESADSTMRKRFQ